MTTAICVLRLGREYKPEHVIDLFADVEKYWPVDRVPLRRVVLTDGVVGMDGVEEMPLQHGWWGWWSKMELFRPNLMGEGDFLFFDLDTVIVGDLSDMVSRPKLTVLEDFYRLKGHIGSGLMYIPAAVRGEVWQRWIAGASGYMRRFAGDQNFLESVWQGKVAYWQDVLPGQVCSYKVHVKGAGQAPSGCRVVCFHGRPRPWNAKWWRHKR